MRSIFLFSLISAVVNNVYSSNASCERKLCRGPRFSQSNCCDNHICMYSGWEAQPELLICVNNRKRLKLLTFDEILGAANHTGTPGLEVKVGGSVGTTGSSGTSKPSESATLRSYTSSKNLNTLEENSKKDTNKESVKTDKTTYSNTGKELTDIFGVNAFLKRKEEAKKRRQLNKDKIKQSTPTKSKLKEITDIFGIDAFQKRKEEAMRRRKLKKGKK